MSGFGADDANLYRVLQRNIDRPLPLVTATDGDTATNGGLSDCRIHPESKE